MTFIPSKSRITNENSDRIQSLSIQSLKRTFISTSILRTKKTLNLDLCNLRIGVGLIAFVTTNFIRSTASDT